MAQENTAETERGETDAPATPARATPTEEIQALTGDPNFMTSLARGLAVIRGFSRQGRPSTITQLSHRTGIPRAAVRRCLYTLAQLGYVASGDGRNFELRPKILGLGYSYLSSAPLTSSAQPVLDRLSGVLHESCSLAVLDNDEVLYVARSQTSTRIMSVDLGVGTRLPAHCSSLGRVLLAALSTTELHAYFRRVKLVQFTNRTVTTAEKLKELLEGVRKRGYAIVDQELEIGLRSMAVPVRNLSGKVAAAMNVSVQAGRVNLKEMEKTYLPELIAAAEEMATLLVR